MTDSTPNPIEPHEPQTEAEYEAAVDELLAQLRRMQAPSAPDEERRGDVLLQQVREMRQELRQVAQAVQQMQAEMLHARDMAAREREHLLLRMENLLLRSERRTPPDNTPEPPKF